MDNVTLTGTTAETVTLYLSFAVTGFAEVGWYDQNYSGGGGINHIVGVYGSDPNKVWESRYNAYGSDSTFEGKGYSEDGYFSGSGSFAMTFSLTSSEQGVASATKGDSVFSNLYASTRNGLATGDFSHTTVLTAITLALRLASTVPEPGSLSLTLAGIAGLVFAYETGRIRWKIR